MLSDEQIQEISDKYKGYSYLAARNAFAREIEATARREALKDAVRLDAIHRAMFQSEWNGVIDSGNKTHWRVTSDYRHFVQNMEGVDFRQAIDAAIEKSK